MNNRIDNLVLVKKRHKPLGFYNDQMITHKNGKLYFFNGHEFVSFYKINKGNKFVKFLSRFRLFERFFRSEPIHVNIVGNKMFLCLHKEILKIDLNTKVTKYYSFLKKSIHTNMTVSIENIKGFDDCVVYGEYSGNSKRDEVKILGIKENEADFSILYTFPKNTIRHIHAIIPDIYDNCVYILTGDDDSESGFWVAKDNFKDIKPLLIGKQDYRSVIAFPLKDSILFSTDFPSAQNKLYIYNKIDKSVSKIADLCGPCTSGATCENGFILSSSVETQEPIKRNKLSNLKYLITRKKAKGVLDDYSRLYYFDYKTLTPKTLLKLKKDFWPAGAFRFGRAISLFHKQTNRLYLFPMAVKKYDGKLFYINLKDIDLWK